MSKILFRQHRPKADIGSLFDHLVGAGDQCGRHCEAERSGGPQIDCQLKLVRPLDRQFEQ
jgi:hypothetical protein